MHRNVREMKARNQEMKKNLRRKFTLAADTEEEAATQLRRQLRATSWDEDDDSSCVRRRQLRFQDETTGSDEDDSDDVVDDDDDDDDEWNSPVYSGDSKGRPRQARLRRGRSESFIMDVGEEDDFER